jgi:hypothetical protein
MKQKKNIYILYFGDIEIYSRIIKKICLFF